MTITHTPRGSNGLTRLQERTRTQKLENGAFNEQFIRRDPVEDADRIGRTIQPTDITLAQAATIVENRYRQTGRQLGASSASSVDTFYFLLEDGDRLILEDGQPLRLE